MIGLRENKLTLAVTPALFVLGILFFASIPRDPGRIMNVSYAGLFLAAAAVAFHIRKPRDLFGEFGLDAGTGGLVYFLLAGLLTGILFASMYRKFLDLSVLPSRLTFFAVTASAIGFTEEILFRGFLQGRLRKISIYWSVVLATLAHTAYKVLLFTALKPVFEVDLVFLFTWTFICGLAFGILKERSGSTFAPATGHVAFDILVYGDRVIAPWWIWA